MSLARNELLHFGVALLCGGLLWSGPSSAQTVQRAAEDAFWDSVKGCSLAGPVEAYREQFRKGRYAGVARACRARDASRPPVTVFRDCPACPEMVVVPAGSFTMGSPPDEAWRFPRENPQRFVTVRNRFAVGKYEVTRREFARFVAATDHSTGISCRNYENGQWKDRSGRGWRNPGFVQDERHPVVCVSWYDARAYVRWLSHETGKRYRLLSEAEWEYAARAGTTTRYHWGDAVGRNRANCDGCGSRWDNERTAPVGWFAPNGFGLHDMHGNVSEWVQDCIHDDYRGAPSYRRYHYPYRRYHYRGPPSDGSARTRGGDCSRRVLRGGSWTSFPIVLRAAFRHRNSAHFRDYYVGFRVARTISP